jgi:hypothetical protein
MVGLNARHVPVVLLRQSDTPHVFCSGAHGLRDALRPLPHHPRNFAYTESLLTLVLVGYMNHGTPYDSQICERPVKGPVPHPERVLQGSRTWWMLAVQTLSGFRAVLLARSPLQGAARQQEKLISLP